MRKIKSRKLAELFKVISPLPLREKVRVRGVKILRIEIIKLRFDFIPLILTFSRKGRRDKRRFKS
jgi:hypothetical protein